MIAIFGCIQEPVKITKRIMVEKSDPEVIEDNGVTTLSPRHYGEFMLGAIMVDGNRFLLSVTVDRPYFVGMAGLNDNLLVINAADCIQSEGYWSCIFPADQRIVDALSRDVSLVFIDDGGDLVAASTLNEKYIYRFLNEVN